MEIHHNINSTLDMKHVTKFQMVGILGFLVSVLLKIKRSVFLDILHVTFA